MIKPQTIPDKRQELLFCCRSRHWLARTFIALTYGWELPHTLHSIPFGTCWTFLRSLSHRKIRRLDGNSRIHSIHYTNIKRSSRSLNTEMKNIQYHLPPTAIYLGIFKMKFSVLPLCHVPPKSRLSFIYMYIANRSAQLFHHTYFKVSVISTRALIFILELRLKFPV